MHCRCCVITRSLGIWPVHDARGVGTSPEWPLSASQPNGGGLSGGDGLASFIFLLHLFSGFTGEAY